MLLADPLSIRARRFRAVLVCGLQESEFPVAAAPDPFLSDELRRELAACSGLRLRPREDGLARERYLFYTSVSRATERVILAYRSSDEEGNLALPSPFLADVAELLAEEWPERRAPADAVRRRLADCRPRRPSASWPAPAPPPRPRAPARCPRRSARWGRRRSSASVTAGSCRPARSRPTRAARSSGWSSASSSRTSSSPTRTPLARGSYMHNVLEQVLRRLGGPVSGDSLPRALELLDEVLAEPPHDIGLGRGDAVRAGWARSVAADLRRYLAHEARADWPWPTYGLELRFGFSSDDGDDSQSLPPLELSEDVRLRGIIDRVDGGPGRHVRSSATTRAARLGPSIRARGGRPIASSRSRCTCSRCGACSASTRWAASTSRSAAAISGRAASTWREQHPVGASSPTTPATRPSSTSSSRTPRIRALALAARLRAGELSRVPRPARATAATSPGSAVLDLSEPDTDERTFTDEQLVAIERREGDLLLDAGAGSGKTSVLVERFARSVLEDGIEVGAILTITFTEKAAAEMRERIRARLRELDADEAARATEGAFISTIHGFCARVLRAHALAAGLDPGLRGPRCSRRRPARRRGVRRGARGARPTAPAPPDHRPDRGLRRRRPAQLDPPGPRRAALAGAARARAPGASGGAGHRRRAATLRDAARGRRGGARRGRRPRRQGNRGSGPAPALPRAAGC